MSKKVKGEESLNVSKKVKVKESPERMVDIFGRKMEDESVTWVGYLDEPEKVLPNPFYMDVPTCALFQWNLYEPEGMGAANYELTEKKVPRMHLVLHSPTKVKYEEIEHLFPGIRIEANDLSEELCDDYINRRGIFRERGHAILIPALYDYEVFGCPRKILDELKEHDDSARLDQEK